MVFVLVVLLGIGPGLAAAHPVERDSQDNRLYILVSHSNLHSSLDNVSISIAMPWFASTGTSLHTPVSVPPDSASLAAFSFDVDPAVAIGTTGEAFIAISGMVAGNPVQTIFTVPLTAAATAPAAVYVGPNLGVEDSDTDGDGFADWVELLFGSDPLYAGSVPGGGSALQVPGLSIFGLLFLAGLLALTAFAFRRQTDAANGGSQ